MIKNTLCRLFMITLTDKTLSKNIPNLEINKRSLAFALGSSKLNFLLTGLVYNSTGPEVTLHSLAGRGANNFWPVKQKNPMVLLIVL